MPSDEEIELLEDMASALDRATAQLDLLEETALDADQRKWLVLARFDLRAVSRDLERLTKIVAT